MFIMAKRNIELPSGDGSQKHKVARGFIGEIPDWACDTPYFRALAKDGKIVIPASKKDSDIAAAGTEHPEEDKKPEEGKSPEEGKKPSGKKGS